MVDIKSLAQQVFKDLGINDIDLSETSIIYKLFIKIIEDIQNEYIGTNGIPLSFDSIYPSIDDESDINRLSGLCELHGINLFTSKGVSRGVIKLIFVDKKDLYIEKGHTFIAGNVEFHTISDINITKDGYGNYSSGLYSIDNVVVENSEGLSVDENSLVSKSGIPNLYKVMHQRISSLSKEYTIDEIKTIFKSRLYNGIIHNLHEKFPGVDFMIVSSGDPLMVRDMMYIAYPYTSNYVKSSNFIGKVRGNTDLNRNVAYKVSMNEENIEDPIDIVAPSDEFTQDQYLSINDKVRNYMSLSSDNIVDSDFNIGFDKIGVSTALLKALVSTDDTLLVKEPDKFSIGDQIYIRRISDNKVLVYDVVKEVVESEVGFTIDGDSIIIDSGYDITYMQFPGRRVMVKLTTGVISSYAFKDMAYSAGSTTITFDSLPLNMSKIMLPSLKLYKQIGMAINPVSSYIIEIPDTVNNGLGGSWIKSDHGKPIGVYSDENAVVVRNGEVVIGNILSSGYENPIISFITKYGKSRFKDNIIDSIQRNNVYDENDNSTESQEL